MEHWRDFSFAFDIAESIEADWIHAYWHATLAPNPIIQSKIGARKSAGETGQHGV
jgi:hypothetical protein